MTHDEALLECERLGREHPDRERFRWFPRPDGAGGWGVARVSTPAAQTLRETTVPPPPAPHEEDPATVSHRNAGWIGGV